MLWSYERRSEYPRLHVRYDHDAGEFVVIVAWPDGREQVERFKALDELQAWSAPFERTHVAGERWRRNGRSC